MKRRLHIMLCLVAPALWSAWVQAQAPTDQNAAVIYQRAIEQLTRFSESSPESYEALMGFDPDVPASAQVRAALAQVQPMLQIVHQGAVLPSCEFPVNRDEGLYMLLPHLNQMRQIARVIRADAAVRLQDGDTSGAAASIADIYRVSNHFNADGTIISSLVGNAIFALADNTVQYGADRGMFGENEARILQEGLQRFNSLDPFDFAGAVAGEREMFGGWLRNSAAEEDEPARIIAELSGIADADLEHEDHPLLLMTRERFEHEVDLYDEVMGKMVDIFKMPDRDAAVDAMAKMEGEIEAMQISAAHGGDGLLVGMLMPALGKAIVTRNKGEKMLADRQAMLGALATGKASPRDFANAAIWYLRGIALLEQADATALASMRALAADPSLPMSPELDAALKSELLQQAIGLFREGSLAGRCEFSTTRSRTPLELLPAYIPGMHDGFRLLHVDAIRSIRAGRNEPAVDQLIACVRMAGHLGRDPLLLSSFAAHCNFNKTIALLDSAMKDSSADQLKPALAEALRRLPAGDAFGYQHAASAARSALGDRLLWLSHGLQTADERQRRKGLIAEALVPLNADQILHLVVVFDAMERNSIARAEAEHAREDVPSSSGRSFQAQRNQFDRLSDIVSLTALESAQSDSSRVAPLLFSGELRLFDGSRPPLLVTTAWGKSFADHIRRAPGDVRSAQALAQTSADKP